MSATIVQSRVPAQKCVCLLKIVCSFRNADSFRRLGLRCEDAQSKTTNAADSSGNDRHPIALGSALRTGQATIHIHHNRTDKIHNTILFSLNKGLILHNACRRSPAPPNTTMTLRLRRGGPAPGQARDPALEGQELRGAVPTHTTPSTSPNTSTMQGFVNQEADRVAKLLQDNQTHQHTKDDKITENTKRTHAEIASSASSATTPARVLKKSKSNDDDMEKVRPTQLFGNEAEPDLMTDEEHKARSNGSSQDKSMPEHNEPEWMTMLKTLMAAHTQDIKGTIVQQGRRIEGVEKALLENKRDTEKRFATVDTKLETTDQKHAATINCIEERMTRLESGDKKLNDETCNNKSTTAGTTSGSMAWTPQHVILGGWTDTTPGETVVVQANLWLNSLGHDITANILEAYAPRKYGQIAKVRLKPGTTDETAFKLQKAIKQGSKSAPPSWATTERSPDAGTRRRGLKLVTDKVRALFPMLDIDSNATIDNGGKEAAKYNMDKREWQARPCWPNTGVSCERFETEMAK